MNHTTPSTLLSGDIHNCTECGACRTACGFLSRYGLPGEIARLSSTALPDPYECSLCGLCGAVCPEDLRPDAFFLNMRRQRVAEGTLDLKPYAPLLGYEKIGSNALFSLLKLPAQGDTVFFPGCSFSGTRSDTVRKVFRLLERHIPNLGVALGCCLKPSHDLGRQAFFEERFQLLLRSLQDAGVRRVITSCPNCQGIFAQYGEFLEAIPVMVVLDQAEVGGDVAYGVTGVVHDPCPARFDSAARTATRNLARRCGMQVDDMRHSGERTMCCGEGGAVGFISPETAESWTQKRIAEADGRRVLTSCAGCASCLGKHVPVDHVLDVVAGNAGRQPTKSPITYLARLALKWWFLRRVS